jgi:hypothetical protein
MNCVTTTTTVCEPCVHPLKYLFEITNLYDVNQSASSTSYEVMDRYLDKGIYVPNCEFCCPECSRYVIASVDTYLKYAENAHQDGYTGCCLNIYAGKNEYLRFAEAGIVTNVSRCCNDFSKCIEDYICWASDKVSYVDSFFDLTDKGIVEDGQFLNNCTGEKVTGVCVLLSLIKEYYGNLSLLYNNTALIDPIAILKLFLDIGIVIECRNGKLLISNVETFLQFAEGQGF